MTEHTFIVPAENAGDRLGRFLSSLPEIGSRAAAERALLGALIDGSSRPKSFRLQGGEEIELVIEDVLKEVVQAEDIELTIAYQDEHLLVIDKAAGLVVHPGAGISSGTLANALVQHRAAGGDPESLCVRDIMSSPARTVGVNTSVATAAAIMRKHHIRHLVVLDENEALLAMIALRYLLYDLMDDMERTLGDLTGYIMTDGPGG